MYLKIKLIKRIDGENSLKLEPTKSEYKQLAYTIQEDVMKKSGFVYEIECIEEIEWVSVPGKTSKRKIYD